MDKKTKELLDNISKTSCLSYRRYDGIAREWTYTTFIRQRQIVADLHYTNINLKDLGDGKYLVDENQPEINVIFQIENVKDYAPEFGPAVIVKYKWSYAFFKWYIDNISYENDEEYFKKIAPLTYEEFNVFAAYLYYAGKDGEIREMREPIND